MGAILEKAVKVQAENSKEIDEERVERRKHLSYLLLGAGWKVTMTKARWTGFSGIPFPLHMEVLGFSSKSTLPENAMQDCKNGACAAGFYAKLLS